MRRVVLLAALCAALFFAAAMPAIAANLSVTANGSDDQRVSVEIPVHLGVLNALAADFVDDLGNSKPGFRLGPTVPDIRTCDYGWLVVKSNDDFVKSFTWTELRRQAEPGEQVPVPLPDDMKIPANQLVVTENYHVLTEGEVVEDPLGISRELLNVDYTPGWRSHGGTYKGTLVVLITQL